MKKAVNLNDYVWVKLTETGERMWAEYWSEIPGCRGVPASVRHTDEHGRTQFQLHELMLIFGRVMFNGTGSFPFEVNAVWFEVDE